MIYTFYSYKGGVGRTHLLANLATYLCYYKKKRVLLIDWDLEAPGLHYYFDKKDKNLENTKGLIDLCNDQIEMLSNADITKNITENDYISPFSDNYIYNLLSTQHTGKIDILPAIEYKEGFYNKINQFDWINFHDNLYGGSYLIWLKDQLKKKYDYVFIDSRTGQNDYSGICNVLMPDMNILVVAPNTQNFEGTKKMAERIINSKYVKDGKRKPFILPILSRIDDITLIKKADEWKQQFVDYFEMCVPIFDENLQKFSKEVLDIVMQKTMQRYTAEFALGEDTYFEENAPFIKESNYLKNIENIALDFLEEMNEKSEISINKIVGNEMIPQYLYNIKQNPNDVNSLFGLGNVYVSLQDYEKAKNTYLKIIDIEPSNDIALNNLGSVYQQKGDFKKAEEMFGQAIQINGENGRYYLERGKIRHKNNDIESAKVDYGQATTYNPDLYEAYYYKFILYSESTLKDKTEALKAAQKIILSDDFKEKIKNEYVTFWGEDTDFEALFSK